MGTLHELGTRECHDLLAARQVGRVAVVAPDGPHIIPVNYAVVEDDLVFRTSPFTLLATHGRDSMVAFEVDTFDEAARSGWSVLVRGRARAVYDSREIDLIRRTWEALPWADGVRNLFLRMTPEEISGRRIGQLEDRAALPR